MEIALSEVICGKDCLWNCMMRNTSKCMSESKGINVGIKLEVLMDQ